MAKIFPADDKVKFLVGDAVRDESGGKTSVLGLYINNEFVIPKGSTFPVGFPMGVHVAVTDGEGQFEASVRITSPSGLPVVDAKIGEPTKLPKKNMTIALQFPIIMLPEFGKYRLALMLDNKAYETNILLSPDA